MLRDLADQEVWQVLHLHHGRVEVADEQKHEVLDLATNLVP